MQRFSFTSLPTPAYAGIVNITPNSFSDGNRFLDPAAAVAHARDLLGKGAKILDLGAEASSFFRPGVTPIDPDEQLRRLLPVVDQLAKIPDVVLSIDTRSSVVAAEMLRRGAHIINDISAGTHDPAMLATVATHHAAVILMHISPNFPENAKENDSDIVRTVQNYLEERMNAAEAAGIGRDQIAIDPGLGFGKTPHDNWTLALRAHEIPRSLNVPLVLGCSRKRFLETAPPAQLLPAASWQDALTRSSRVGPHPPQHPRDPATFALTDLTLQNGIRLHRLHVFPPTSQRHAASS
jgi:dihydropteroate synthase